MRDRPRVPLEFDCAFFLAKREDLDPTVTPGYCKRLPVGG